MPSSVIDDGSDDILGAGSKKGMLAIPINNPDGKRTVVTSSTMTAEEMKDFKDKVERDVRKDGADNNLDNPLGRFHMNIEQL